MAPLDTTLVMLFSNDVIKRVFEEVLKNRSVMFKDIRESLKSEAQSGAENIAVEAGPRNADLQGEENAELDAGKVNSEIEDAVEKLKEQDLIKERPAEIKDFNRYYITANGLTAERQLASAERALASSRS